MQKAKKMLDIKFIRANPDIIKASLVNRKARIDIDKLIALDVDKRQLLQEAESLKNKRNEASKEIGELIKQGKSAEPKKADVKAISQKIAEI
ncbi:MAG: serine--tRNA ligase, partial [Candidatus Orphnella occulta]|nr:serine--tRNA ligase [Candidatus Orphnella occulta]